MPHIWTEDTEAPKQPVINVWFSDGLMQASIAMTADELEGYAKVLIVAARDARKAHRNRKASRNHG